jgi:argininosuccinate lyase
MLTILKGQPSGYNRDLQEDKIHVFSAADTIRACVEIAAAIVGNTKFNVKAIAGGLDQGFLDATGLAEYLVVKGVAFREAHGIVGALVAECEEQGKEWLGELGVDDFKRHCGVIEQDVYEHLGAINLVNKYATAGAAGPRQAKEQIAYWKNELAKR